MDERHETLESLNTLIVELSVLLFDDDDDDNLRSIMLALPQKGNSSSSHVTKRIHSDMTRAVMNDDDDASNVGLLARSRGPYRLHLKLSAQHATSVEL
jgi:hypothetical protein